MEKYTLSMRILHWVMALLIITLLSVGFWMVGLPNDNPDKFNVIYPMHKSFGVLALLLIIIRIIQRFRVHIPQLPEQINQLSRTLFKIDLLLLYICMVAQPLSGYLMSTLGGHDVLFFGLKVPSLFAENKDLAKFFWRVHLYNGYGLVIFIVLHLIGNTKHYFVDKVNLLRRMW